MRRAVICWCFMLVAATMATAQDANDMRTLGSALTGPPLALGGDLVMESVGLIDVIRDYSTPEQPSLAGWLDHDLSGFYGHRVTDDGLVVALQSNLPWGFDIIDATDPATPTIVHSNTGTAWSSGWLQDQVLALATSEFCVIYHLGDPTTPFFLGALSLGGHEGRRHFAAVGSVLYGIDRGARLRAIDLDAAEPVDLGTVSLDATRIDAMIAGDGVLYAVVSGEDRRLLTLQPGDPLDLTVVDDRLLSDAEILTDAQIVRRDNTLVVAAGDGTMTVFDTSQPLQPLTVGVLPHDGRQLAVTDQLILALADETLRISDLATLEQIAARPVIPNYRTILGHGSVVLAQREDLRHVVVPVDISNPEVPQPGEAVDLEFGDILSLGGDLLLASNSSSRFDVWDVSDPRTPLRLSTVEDPDALFGRAFVDGHRVAFFNLLDAGIVLYDLSDPSAPVRATNILTAYPRAYRNGLLLSGVGSPLRLFTAYDPHRPKLASRISLNGSPLAATLGPGLLLVSVERLPGEVTLHLRDTTDPRNVTELSTLPLPGRATNLVVHGNRVYAQGFQTTWVVDISNPLNPTLDGEFDTWGQAGRGLAFHDDLTLNSGWLVSLHDAGFVITDTPIPGATTSVLHPAYPNPFNPSTTVSFDIVRAGRYQLAVHDLRGRLVAELLSGALPEGRHTVQWAGLDTSGRPAASGAYLLRLTGENVDSHQTITLVK